MQRFDFSRYPDHALTQTLERESAKDRVALAERIALLGEVDSRRLYRAAGFPSMFEYCVKHLHYSEATAFKRIRVARAARRLPCLFETIASGRVHVTGLALLAPHLKRKNCEAVLTRATHKTVQQIRELVAELAPRPDVPTRLVPILVPAVAVESAETQELVLKPVGPVAEHAVQSSVPAPVPLAATVPDARPAITPLAPARFAFQVTLTAETHELMREAQDALGSGVNGNDYDRLLQEAFKALIAQKHKQRFAATERPRARRSHGEGRYVPSKVKREVWTRDEGQCSFRSDSGHRCESKRDLEYDHVIPVARGGQTSTSNLRLRCRAHNALEAERVFGEEFMRAKRELG
jgi:5-methylcytosine-specific restriction endonuclease McrA